MGWERKRKKIVDKKAGDVDKKGDMGVSCEKLNFPEQKLKFSFRELKFSFGKFRSLYKNRKLLRDRFTLIKWRFGLYVPLCLLLAFAGSFIIGKMTNYFQDECMWRIVDGDAEFKYRLEYWYDEDGQLYRNYIGRNDNPDTTIYETIYRILSIFQFLAIIIWVLFSVFLVGNLFYNKELKIPINLLMDASRRIADNQLDFMLEYNKPNEFGMLCRAFDEMRLALYESNRELWRSLEERKRLNAAFSHDLRTPLTVLRGYVDFLAKYVPGGKVTEEKLLGVLGMMSSQIVRLEHYTKTMNSVQKLGDIVPQPVFIEAEEMKWEFGQTGELLCAGKEFVLDWRGEETLYFDVELVSQIYENLVSNAARYAAGRVIVQCFVEGGEFFLVVSDDGKGFRREALQNAAEPFFRDEREPDKTHFGMGLYICRILCEKCGGVLKVGNVGDSGDGAHGGKVTAMVNCLKMDRQE